MHRAGEAMEHANGISRKTAGVRRRASREETAKREEGSLEEQAAYAISASATLEKRRPS
jgi:hypothetical protein